MPVAYDDIEVTQPLPTIQLDDNESGLAILARYHGCPVGFWLDTLPRGARVTPEMLSARIAVEAGAAISLAQMRSEAGRVARDDGRVTVTVAICTRNRPERLERLLGSLMQAGVAAHPNRVEILVVDNAPPDDRTHAVVSRFPAVRYTMEPRPGLNFGRNRAWREARKELVAYVDDDVVVDRGWLSGLLEAHGTDPEAGGFTGLVVPFALETEAQVLFERNGGFRRGVLPKRHQLSYRYDTSFPVPSGEVGAGANMCFRRDLLARLGGFDEALDTGPPLPGGGDLDMFYRVLRAGYAIAYAPSYLVFHEHRRERSELKAQYESWGRGFMAFLAKCYRTDPSERARHAKLMRWWLASQAKILGQALRGKHPLPADMVLAEIRGGLVGLFGEYARSERRISKIRREYASSKLAEAA
jgi:GT2 family glycosyltransferase